MCTRLEDHHPKKKKCLKIENLENSLRPFPEASAILIEVIKLWKQAC
jgi:hypothetical protein